MRAETAVRGMTFVLHPEEGDDPALFGGKAWALKRLTNSGLPIPPWFVGSPNAFDSSRTPAQQDRVESGADGISLLLTDLAVGESVCREIEVALTRLCPNDETVAVRSSAVDEDGSGDSFAGQLESFLWVRPEEVPDRIVDVWRS